MIGNDVWLKLIIRIRLLSLYQWTFTNVCRMNKQETVFPLKCSLTYVQSSEAAWLRLVDRLVLYLNQIHKRVEEKYFELIFILNIEGTTQLVK